MRCYASAGAQGGTFLRVLDAAFHPLVQTSVQVLVLLALLHVAASWLVSAHVAVAVGMV